MNLLKRLSVLEKKQPQNLTCFPLRYFYGEPAKQEPLIPNQTLSDFYQSLEKEQQHG